MWILFILSEGDSSNHLNMTVTPPPPKNVTDKMALVSPQIGNRLVSIEKEIRWLHYFRSLL